MKSKCIFRRRERNPSSRWISIKNPFRISRISFFTVLLGNPKKELICKSVVVNSSLAVNMADRRQRVLTLMVLLFEEFIDKTFESELTEMVSDLGPPHMSPRRILLSVHMGNFSPVDRDEIQETKSKW